MTLKGRAMRIRWFVCAGLAVVALSAAASVAVALPSVCPSNFHDGGTFHNTGAVVPGVPDNGSLCISDSRHMAPSGYGSIPNMAVLKDPRVRLRVEIAIAGTAAASALLLVGFARRPRWLSPSPLATADV